MPSAREWVYIESYISHKRYGQVAKVINLLPPPSILFMPTFNEINTCKKKMENGAHKHSQKRKQNK